MLAGMGRPANGDFGMRYWMLITLGAGCGQMYPAPGSQPTPMSPGAGAQGRSPSPGDDPGAPQAQPSDPAAGPVASEPPPPAPVPEPAARRDPARSDRGRGGAPRADPRSPPAAKPAAPTEAQAMVDAHNRVRAKHCASPLAWSPKLAQAAQRWANALRDKGCAFGHSNGSYGENLAAGTTGLLDPEATVKMWYDEIAQYKFPDGGFAMQTGRFTQVVWRGTTEVGCGRSQCKGMDIWVCEYDPPGNWEGQYRDNVRPLGCR